MTPFGQTLKELCKLKKLSHDQLAAKLRMTPVSLTSLMNGFNGLPSPVLIFQIERALELTRFELENLKAAARLSNPDVNFNLAGLDLETVELVNLLSQYLRKISPGHMAVILQQVKKAIDKL